MSHSYSEETLYHHQCKDCNQWWTIGDKFIEKQYCPKCGSYQEVYSVGDARGVLNGDHLR